MNVPIIAFFNNKGGAGKTSLIYHLAWMYADLGIRVITADLDPQANLTAVFLEEERLELLWPKGNHSDTIYGCISPLLKGSGDIAKPHLEYIEDQMSLFPPAIALLSVGLAVSLRNIGSPCWMNRQARTWLWQMIPTTLPYSNTIAA